MKKSLLLLAVLAMTVSAQAQHEEGDVTIQPRVGVTFSNITGDNLFMGDKPKMKVNVTYGFEVEYSFTDKFSIAGGLLFTDQGYKFDYYEFVDGRDLYSYQVTAKFNNYYAAVPITLNYYLVEGLAIKAGVQPAFRVKTKLEADGTKMDLDDALEFLFPNKDVTVNKFDLMIPVGLSYEYKNIVLDARYNFGLIKVFKGLDVTSRNSLITLTLGYKL
ncbi:MAG: PorT family protein [Prevotella sp.]|nr:PorT family protein [Prevotella sp.]